MFQECMTALRKNEVDAVIIYQCEAFVCSQYGQHMKQVSIKQDLASSKRSMH